MSSKKPEVSIGVVAKYLDHEDTYMSVVEALKAAGWKHGRAIKVVWVDAEKLVDSVKPLAGLDGILVPGGFGERGVAGKIVAAKFARENKVPYLGICLGLQIAVIEAARNLVGLETAHSLEFDRDTEHHVVSLMEDQQGVRLGGSMRLGDYPTAVKKGTLAHRLYGGDLIHERHRHRYEVNNRYRDRLEASGMVFSGLSPDGNLVEMIEYPDHPFFIASQFHPEFTSRPMTPNPLFDGFVAAASQILHSETEKSTIDVTTMQRRKV